MRTGTKIGWALVALAIIISVTVIVAGSSDASIVEGDFILSDDGTIALDYTGTSGVADIPAGVVTLSDGLFTGETSLYSVSMPDSVTSLGANFCAGCSQLDSVYLSSNISSIPSGAFSGCENLYSISLPSVSSIGAEAFYNCDSLTSISIPSSCSSIAETAFDECDNLAEISVSSGNSNYSSYDGCLYNAAQSRLIYVPGGKTSVEISDSCATIGSGAFRDAASITSVTIPASVETIESGAIPSNVTIYGYADSAAEIYAKNNGNPFIVIGGDTPQPSPSPEPTPDPEPGPITPQPGDTDNGDGTVTRADGTVVDKATGRVIRAGTGSTGNSHAKDATPGTADGVNPVYFLCLAVFLGGAGTLVYTRVRKVKYVKKK